MSRLLTTAELAEQLHMNEETVRKLAREKRIPSIRLTRTWRYDPAAVEQALAKASEPAPADAERMQPA
jgi:excisionase family DNA binding protein